MFSNLLATTTWHYVFGILMFSSALILILLVLVQRGRGGGLAGALGGMGGQSAFGTKAGDFFTKITIVVASFWILLCVAAVIVLGGSQGKFQVEGDGVQAPSPTETSDFSNTEETMALPDASTSGGDANELPNNDPSGNGGS